MRRNKLMTLALAVICGVSVMTTSVKAEAMYYETEDGIIIYEDKEVIVTEQLKDESQNRAENTEKLEIPANLRIDTKTNYTTFLVWDEISGVSRYDVEVYRDGKKISTYSPSRNKFSLVFLEKENNGEYTIKVRAVASDTALNSDWASIIFQYNKPNNKLNTPTNIVWDNNSFGTIMWDFVEGASGYSLHLYCDGEYVIGLGGQFSSCKCDLSPYLEDEGEYTVEITAFPGNINEISSSDTGSSNKLTYKIAIQKLSVPTNIRWEGTVLKWDAVENASKYEEILCLNQREIMSFSGKEPLHDMKSYFYKYGNGIYTVKVKALSDDLLQYANSEYATSPEYVVGDVPGYTEEQKEQVRNFVKRLYQVILNREADEVGLNAWTQQLLDRKATGAQIVGGFVESDEFTQRGLTNEEVVEIMYQAMLDRDSDDAGREGWTKILNGGCSYIYIVNGFSGSAEFNGICNTYGIDAGIVNTDRKRDRNPQLTQFVSRCYTQALGRQYETNGLEDWCDAIISGRNTPKEAAQMFIFSDEFIQKNLNNEEYVRVLYRTFMGREADEDGLAAWVEVLESGREDRMKVLEGFSDSVEFDGILQSFGLK